MSVSPAHFSRQLFCAWDTNAFTAPLAASKMLEGSAPGGGILHLHSVRPVSYIEA